MTPATRDRIKRVLGPLLPILRPVKRKASGFMDRWRSVRLALVKSGYALRAGARVVLDRASPPIRALRKHEFDALVERAPYYRPRWAYISAAGRIADGLIAKYGLRTALELGPHLRPVIVGADAMDRHSVDDLQAEGKVTIHDATKTPWPFADKEYDLFVALQVFEHLGDQQAAAFREVRRIARHAEISLPIDWVMSDPTNCHHQISNEKALSWFAPVIPTRVEIGNGGAKRRLIYVFENLEA
jgi:hypothetical protein